MNVTRVAQVSALFWVIKILTTGAGETGADFLDHTFNPIPVVLLALVALVVALVWQLRAKSYSPLRYWVAVTMVSVFGTLAADAVHVALGIPYWASTAAFTVALIAAFAIWRAREGTLEMSAITTLPRELFYWLIVMITFALGTAAGDWLAMGLNLGFLGGSAIFTLLFVLPLVLGKTKALPTTLAFWLAYTFTRPMGASIADYLALPHERGGLGFGTLAITLFWFVLIALTVAFSARTARQPGASTNRP